MKNVYYHDGGAYSLFSRVGVALLRWIRHQTEFGAPRKSGGHGHWWQLSSLNLIFIRNPGLSKISLATKIFDSIASLQNNWYTPWWQIALDCLPLDIVTGEALTKQSCMFTHWRVSEALMTRTLLLILSWISEGIRPLHRVHWGHFCKLALEVHTLMGFRLWKCENDHFYCLGFSTRVLRTKLHC